ncbi:enoyl-CoA hydratase/isomerase family protein [Bradyrhizobium sp. LHD-71]|uniref:enoyl-CoA hydratase/isomerase family protein n=1 Tax=Bradyrhizobium sp. LHD-71 TaxID=3072141 RepID=UPI00280F105B|nr:enoyl-CoA hydratase/isomerase family protein [Bradyrhizobium sp. LHD-71]MDQ8731854.1 enoyl-CoA hydratase/isomerase family protein [Bradyrhizobium sp. LHD-71]
MNRSIIHSVENHVGTIMFNRPESRNAFTLEMLEECARILLAFRDDPQVRVIVITGAGESFCAGGDVKSMGRPISVAQRKSDLWNRMQIVPKTLAMIDKPVIAMINGDAVGGGMDIALMCDIRVASDKARFSQAYVKLGLAPGDGGAFFLARLIGLGRALELLLTGDFVDATEAARLGIVNHTVPHGELKTRTHEIAHKLASLPPLSVQTTKRLTYQSLQSEMISALELASSQAAILASTDDHKEAVQAFREKRRGRYNGT